MIVSFSPVFPNVRFGMSPSAAAAEIEQRRSGGRLPAHLTENELGLQRHLREDYPMRAKIRQTP